MLKNVCRLGVMALVLVALFAVTDLSASASGSSCSAKLSKKSSKAVHFTVKCKFGIKKIQGTATEAGGGGAGKASGPGCKTNSSTKFTCSPKKTQDSFTGTYTTNSQLCNPELQLKLSINNGKVKKSPLAQGCASGQY